MNQKKVPQKIKQKSNKQPIKPAPKTVALGRQEMLLLIFLLVAVFVAYFPTLSKEFVNYDDDLYITNNPHIKDFTFSKIPEIFGSFYYAQYSPMASVVCGILNMMVGFRPFLFNLVGLFLHMTVVLLVFRFLWSLTRKFRVAFITTALFGLATIQVEAIAWSASVFMKTGYSIIFLISLIIYIKYTRTNKVNYYIISLLLLVLAFLFKEQAVALSLAVVAVDLYLGRKLFSKKVLLEKIPFFVLSICCGLVTIAAARSYDTVTTTSFGFGDRFIYACYALGNYIFKTIVPVKLAMFYAYPSLKTLKFIYILYPIIVVVLSGLWIWAVIKKHKAVLFGGLFFFFNLLLSLVLLVISVREVVMADRYVYIASIGLFFIIASGADKLLEKKKIKMPVFIVFFSIYLLFLGVMTFNRTKTWKNSVVMYTTLLEYDNSLAIAYRNRGNYYRDLAAEYTKQGNNARVKELTDLAFADFSNLTVVEPKNASAYVSRGRIYFDRKELDKAIQDFTQAIKLNPKSYEAYTNRGAAFATQSKLDIALDDFNAALAINPKWKEGLINRALVYYSTGIFDKAIPDLDEYLKLFPDAADSYNLRGLCKVQIKDFEGALKDYNTAMQYKPNQAIYLQNRALLYNLMGNKTAAEADMAQAQQLAGKG